jgi:hypothetical protein
LSPPIVRKSREAVAPLRRERRLCMPRRHLMERSSPVYSDDRMDTRFIALTGVCGVGGPLGHRESRRDSDRSLTVR